MSLLFILLLGNRGWAADENWTQQGELLLGMGRYTEAARMFTQAIEVEGLKAETLLGRGLARLYAGKLEIAEEDLTRAIDMAPDNPHAFTARGTARFNLGQYGAAIEDYTRALAADDAFTPAYNQLAWALAVAPDRKLRNSERALEMAHKAVDLDPNIHHQDTLAAALASAGKYTQAAVMQKEVLRRAIKNDQTDQLEAYTERLKRYEAGKPWRITALVEKSEKTTLATQSSKPVTPAPPPKPAPKPDPIPDKTPEPSPPKPAVKHKAKIPEAKKPALPPPPAPESKPAVPPPEEAEAPETPETEVPQRKPPADQSPSVPPGQPPRPMPYTIQVSSYPEQLRSHGIALDLRDKGDAAFTSPTRIEGKGTQYRVFIGYFSQINQARTAAEELKKRNFRQADIVVKPFTLQVGRSDSPLELDHLESKLSRSGYLGYRLPDPDQPRMTRLLVGAYGTETEARPIAKTLHGKGFKPKIVAR